MSTSCCRPISVLKRIFTLPSSAATQQQHSGLANWVVCSQARCPSGAHPIVLLLETTLQLSAKLHVFDWAFVKDTEGTQGVDNLSS